MKVIFFIVVAVGCVFAVWNLVNPQSLWRATTARLKRNPDASEPSDAGYAISRVVSVIALVALIVAAVVVWNADAAPLPAVRNSGFLHY